MMVVNTKTNLSPRNYRRDWQKVIKLLTGAAEVRPFLIAPFFSISSHAFSCFLQVS
jgi:hypothetical protein